MLRPSDRRRGSLRLGAPLAIAGYPQINHVAPSLISYAGERELRQAASAEMVITARSNHGLAKITRRQLSILAAWRESVVRASDRRRSDGSSFIAW
jgi:hypothetical protein